jgi:hypothetical protein
MDLNAMIQSPLFWTVSISTGVVTTVLTQLLMFGFKRGSGRAFRWYRSRAEQAMKKRRQRVAALAELPELFEHYQLAIGNFRWLSLTLFVLAVSLGTLMA